jgi:hypothetical protein
LKPRRITVKAEPVPEVDAYDTGVPGLVVHRAIRWHGSALCWATCKTWNVTHEASGLGVCVFLPTRKEALRVARLLGELDIDWKMPEPILRATWRKHPHLLEAVRDIVWRGRLPRRPLAAEEERR